MFNWFTHPATVHMPLSIALLAPAAHATLWWLVSQRNWPKKIWLLFFLLLTVQLLSVVVAYVSGERAVMFSAAPPELTAEHLFWAKMFSLFWLAIAFSTVLQSRFRFTAFKVCTLSLLLAQIAVAIWLGHMGGRLVFGSSEPPIIKDLPREVRDPFVVASKEVR